MGAVSDIRNDRLTSGRRAPGRRESRAFTLVELLVVILILMVLLSISWPTIGKVQSQIRSSNSQAIVNLIHGACQQYQQQLGRYPMDVAHLVRELTGYLPKGAWDPAKSKFDAGDGLDGFGMRLVPRGRKYGPYGGTEGLRWDERDDVDVFLDAFNGPILYSRYIDPHWQPLDQYGGPDNPPEPQQPITMHKYLENQDGRPFRIDFAVLSRGPDGRWDPYCTGTGDDRKWTRSDDITNLLNE